MLVSDLKSAYYFIFHQGNLFLLFFHYIFAEYMIFCAYTRVIHKPLIIVVLNTVLLMKRLIFPTTTNK